MQRVSILYMLIKKKANLTFDKICVGLLFCLRATNEYGLYAYNIFPWPQSLWDIFRLWCLLRPQLLWNTHQKSIYYSQGECQWGSACAYIHKPHIEIDDTDNESLDYREEESFDKTLFQIEKVTGVDSINTK